MSYKKLVRDKIPEIIKQKEHKEAIVRILDDNEYLFELNRKIKEELNEYLESGDIEELADLEEVLRAILDSKGVTYEEFEKIRQEKVEFYFAQIKKLFEGLKMVLSSSTDFSLYHTLMEISKESKVYDNFEQTLKNNTVAEYCRTNIYETVKEIFIPEQEVMQKALLSYAKDKNFDMHKFVSENRAEILKKYMETPLAKIDKEKKYSLIESIKYTHDVFNNISID